jgi:hypothetical protein
VPRGGVGYEDFVVATRDVAIVLDGVSVPKGMETGCSHGTAWYVRQLGTRLLPLVSALEPQPLSNCLADAINQVAALHRDSCDLTHPGTPAATVAILRTTGFIEWLCLSDAVIVLDTLYEGLQVIRDSRVEETAIDQATTVLAAAPGTPEHAERRREMVTQRRIERNIKGGYWVAAATPEAAGHAVTGLMRPGTVRQAAVLSDGAARLVDFGLADWPEVFDILAQHGPAELISRVRDAEASDLEGQRWPRSKVYDDATVTYARIDNAKTNYGS